MAGFIKRWTKRVAVGGLVGIAALVGSYYAADRHLTQKYEHGKERETVTQGIEKLVNGDASSLSRSYTEFLEKQGYKKRMDGITLENCTVLFVEEIGDERVAYYRAAYKDKSGERHSTTGTFVLRQEGGAWKILGE